MILPAIASKTLLHAAYVENTGNGDDAVVASEIIEYEDGTTKPNLQVYKNPQVSFWVTQTQHRDHPDKKEFEALTKLDEFVVPYKDKDREIFKVLKGYFPNFLSPNQRRELYQSPYVYGGNITIEARLGMKYKLNLEKSKKVSQTPTTGFFDIEKSLLNDSYGKLPLMVFVAENKVYLAMHKQFMQEECDGKMVAVTCEDVVAAAHEFIDPLVASIFKEKGDDLKDYASRLPFQYEVYAGANEVEMIKWIFGKMHESKTSFIGIWNLGFDIPEIIQVLEREGIPLHEVFADPSLRDTGVAYTSYREDKRKLAHITQKWNWLTNTAHFQFVDSMSLYSYIRVVEGKEASYALDDILKKFGVGGKLKLEKCAELEGLQTADWHRAMLSRFFVPYALYAMWDGMSLQILEWLNNDLTAMLLLGDTTPPKFFPNQTIRVTNDLFQNWLPRGYVLGTGVDIESERDEDLLNGGGAVLEPQNLIAKGMQLFEEWPNHHTHAYSWNVDVDFSALYPSVTYMMNISKQTKVSTLFTISGDNLNKYYNPYDSVEVLSSYLITPTACGYDLGKEFFSLPRYQEVDDLFREHIR